MSLKYLVSALQARPGALDLPAGEFEQLLSDVQIGRNSAKAQEEFYDSMEKVINELKAHPVEIEPFLRPVTKKIAADYENVINNPMDLGTVLKNIKAKQYRSKKKFAADLNLIWDNALKYNSVEGHPIRAQAIFCRKLANHLLDVVPDRADAIQGISIAGRPAGGSGHVNGSESKLDGEGGGAEGVKVVGMGTGLLADGIGGDLIRPGYHPLKTTLGDMPAILRDSNGMQPLDLLLKADPPAEPKKKANLRARQRVGRQAPAWYPLSMAPAATKPSEPSPSSSSGALATGDLEKDKSPIDEVTQDTAWWLSCNDSGLLGEVIPPVPQGEDSSPAATPLPRKRKRSDDLPPVTSMQDVVNGNVAMLAKVRRRYQRLQTRLNDPEREEVLSDSASSGSEDGAKKLKKLKAKKSMKRRGPMDKTEAYMALRTMTGEMVAHSGFEGCTESALGLSTQLVSAFMSNFGRSVAAMLDRDGQSADLQSALSHSLLANGMMRTLDLDLYIREDLAKYGSRLEEAAKKLKQAFVEVDVDAEEVDVDETDMMFGGLPGMDDMAEFLGIQMPSVPRRLLAGRKKAAEPTVAAKNAAPASPYDAPIPFAPFTSADLPQQIGLLQEFFAMKLESMGDVLPDEEFENLVPPLGPFGQIVQRSAASVKKKAAEGATRGAKRGGGPKRGAGGTRGRGGRGGKLGWLDTGGDLEQMDEDVEMEG